MYSKDLLTVVLEKFHKNPFTNKKVACRRQAMQRVIIQVFRVLKTFLFSGGTLGLFTGMSLLSIIELFYWVLKLMKKVKEFVADKMVGTIQMN